MKRFSFIVLFSFFGLLTGFAQSKYAVEIIGGMKINGFGLPPAIGYMNGVTAGLGASVYLSRTAEFVGTTLFTYFPPSNPMVTGHGIAPYGGVSADDAQYSTEITAGLRFHGQGSQYFHPYLIVQTGMVLLKSAVYQGAGIAPAVLTPQLLNIPGTGDIRFLGAINAGGGLQARITESVFLNLEAKYQLLIMANAAVESFVPIMISVQLPV